MRREDAEVADLIGEDVLVALLQRVVEDVVPAVEQHGQEDDRELDDDHRGQQAAAGPFVLGAEIGRAIRHTVASVERMLFTECVSGRRAAKP